MSTIIKTDEITVTQASAEMARLMEEFPDRRGSCDGVCVYYKGPDGAPVNLDGRRTDESNYDLDEMEPICIVGMWIEQFHVDFKYDPFVKKSLLMNNAADMLDLPVSDQVAGFLRELQSQQDDGRRWGDLDLKSAIDHHDYDD